jgi:MFS family permease
MSATTTDPLDSRYSWMRLALSLAIASIGNVGMWSVIVVMPAVQAEFGTGRGEASLPYTLTMLGFALGNLLIGRVVDRHGVTFALSAAAILSGLGYLAAAASPSILVLALAQFVVGLGTAAFFGPLIADVSLWFRRRRGIAVAITASGNYLAGAIWPVALAGVLSGQGWRAVYVVLAVLVAGAVLPLAQLLRRRLTELDLSATAQASPFQPRRVPWSPRALMWLLALAGIGCCVAMSMPQVHIVALCVDLGFGPAVGAEMLALMLMGGVVSRLVSGVIADRLGGVMTLLIGSVLQMLALILYLPQATSASARFRSTLTSWLTPCSAIVTPNSRSIRAMVMALWVMIRNRVSVRRVISSSRSQNRTTLASSSGASTSSSTQIGAGLARNTAKISASAVSVCSPPDSRLSELTASCPAAGTGFPAPPPADRPIPPAPAAPRRRRKDA